MAIYLDVDQKQRRYQNSSLRHPPQRKHGTKTSTENTGKASMQMEPTLPLLFLPQIPLTHALASKTKKTSIPKKHTTLPSAPASLLLASYSSPKLRQFLQIRLKHHFHT